MTDDYTTNIPFLTYTYVSLKGWENVLNVNLGVKGLTLAVTPSSRGVKPKLFTGCEYETLFYPVRHRSSLLFTLPNRLRKYQRFLKCTNKNVLDPKNFKIPRLMTANLL